MVRVKRRYIVVKLIGRRSQDSFEDQDIYNEITGQIEQSYGDFGVACLKRGFNIKKRCEFSNYIIIQVRKGVHEMVMSVIPMINKLGGKQCQMNLIHLSGTLRGALKHVRQKFIMSLREAIGKKMAADAAKVKSRTMTTVET